MEGIACGVCPKLMFAFSKLLLSKRLTCTPVCKSCIVKHLPSNNECPICNVVVHDTQPLLNIR